MATLPPSVAPEVPAGIARRKQRILSALWPAVAEPCLATVMLGSTQNEVGTHLENVGSCY